MATTTTSSNVFHCCCYYPSRSTAGGEVLALARNFRLNLMIQRNLFAQSVHHPKAKLNIVRCAAGEDLSEGPEKPQKPRRRKSAPASEDVPKVKRQTRKKSAETGSEDETIEKKPKPSRTRKKAASSVASEEETPDTNLPKKKAVRRTTKSFAKSPDDALLETADRGKIIRGPSWVVTMLDEEEEDEVKDYEDEEEEEVEEDEDGEDQVRPQEPQFPNKESYALVSTYKKLEKPPALENDQLWWNWQMPKPEDHYWSEFQKREGEAEITLAAMAALSGQIKLFGDTPSVAETSLYRARKYVFKEERLAAEEDRLFEIGPLAYYSEWAKAWDKDTSREAVQKHYEETGEDEDVQLQLMLCCQTREEFRHMMGTDMRIMRDPLVMRATEEMKKTVYGGDPVYPTINYIRDPDEVVDWRGPNFREPRMTPCEYFKKLGLMKTREQHNELMALEQLEAEAEEALLSDDEELGDEELAAAVDIGEKDDEEDEDGDEALEDDDEVVSLEDEVVALEDEALKGDLKDEDIEVVPTAKLAELLTEEDEDEEGL